MTNNSKIEKDVARCDKFGDFADGRHVMDVENSDLNIAELRMKHRAIIEHENDLTQDLAVAVRREIIRRAPINGRHCQSCGTLASTFTWDELRDADGYSPCCNELFICKCNHNDCFHVA
jgi:hypothetical protein